jgi:PAS domain S-box-containing protein
MVSSNQNNNADESANVDRYQHLLEHIQDAVVEFELIDGDPIIRSVNSAFIEIFGYDASEVQGKSLNELIVPEWLSEEAKDLDKQTSSGEITYRQVTRETDSGLREFLYRGIPHQQEPHSRGGTAVYTDLTEIKQQEQRLQVINRVLRHNLRNKSNIISGHTTQLLGELETQTEERTDTAVTIENASNDLEKLAKEAEIIHDVISDIDNDSDRIDCIPVIYKVVEEYKQSNPDVVFKTSLPESTVVRASDALHFVIDSLVENAIEHNTSDVPHVRVRVTADEADRWISVYVEDNGPQIPATERRVITGDEDISPLHHGSGLGLWLAKWTSEKFGGEISFSMSDIGGNSVRIRLLQAGHE